MHIHEAVAYFLTCLFVTRQPVSCEFDFGVFSHHMRWKSFELASSKPCKETISNVEVAKPELLTSAPFATVSFSELSMGGGSKLGP